MPIPPVPAKSVQAIRPASREAADLKAISPMDQSIKQLDRAIAALQKQHGSTRHGGADAFASHSQHGVAAHHTTAHARTHETAPHAHVHREPTHRPAHHTTHATHQAHGWHSHPDTDDSKMPGNSKGAMPGTVIGNEKSTNFTANFTSNFLDQLGGFGAIPVAPAKPQPVAGPAVQLPTVEYGGPGNSQNNYGHSEEHMNTKGGGGRSGAVIGN